MSRTPKHLFLTTLFIGLFGLVSCGSQPEVPQISGRPLDYPAKKLTSPSMVDFQGRRIAEMTVVVFRVGLSAPEWESIFRRTDRMTQLRNDIARLKGKVLSDSERDSLDAKTIEVAEILIWLYENSSAYLLNWSAVENCRFSNERFPRLDCAPQYDIYGPNPIAGDNPIPFGPLRFFHPDEDSRMKGEGVALRFSNTAVNSGSYGFEIRLRPEGIGSGRTYTGEVVVDPESVFRRDNRDIPHYPFGYAEVRFEEDAGE